VTVDELVATIRDGKPPSGLPPLVHALWLDAHGDWDGAHQIAQDDDGREAAWVHAYLHRKEGDRDNAAYWYRRAAQPVADGPLEDEWRHIATAFLGGHAAIRASAGQGSKR
jgi:hypothetical protein